jgi:hypothetical protein
VVDTVKEEFGCLEYFSSLPTHLPRLEWTFSLCPSREKELAEEIITPLELKKE